MAEVAAAGHCAGGPEREHVLKCSACKGRLFSRPGNSSTPACGVATEPVS